MTPEEKAFCEEVTTGANSLAALFLAISQEATEGGALYSKQVTRILELCRRGGLAAMSMGGNAAQRVIGAEHATETAQGYDLAALAKAPPARVEE